MKKIFAIIFTLTVVACQNSHAFKLKSKNIKPNSTLSEEFVFDGFGCTGKNISPKFSWKNPPKETKSFAFTIYDPDAPTGSGWWHWILVDIPVKYNKLPLNFGKNNKFDLKDGIKQVRNDFGLYKFGGACPPKGDKPHRYIFTIHALKVESLNLDKNATAALAGYMINANSIEKQSFKAYFKR